MFNKIQRLVAILIDYVIILMVADILYSVLVYFNEIKVLEIIFMILYFIVVVCLLVVKDCIFGYTSIGKKILGMKIYQNDEVVTDKKLLLKRNLKTILLFPLYPFMILIKNQSLGDKKTNTKIVYSDKLLFKVITILILVMIVIKGLFGGRDNINLRNSFIEETNVDLNLCRMNQSLRVSKGFLVGYKNEYVFNCSENKEKIIEQMNSWSDSSLAGYEKIENNLPDIKNGYYYAYEINDIIVYAQFDRDLSVLYLNVQTKNYK